MEEAGIDESLSVSVCIDCARHPSLKQIIEDDLIVGICAFCCRTDAKVRNTETIEPMVMLIRSLIRFYWDEAVYNSHWGGDGVLELFCDAENPVVEPFVAESYYDEFDYLLQEPPYPDWKMGVSIYAGFDADGLRMMNFAISRTTPMNLRKLRATLDIDNFSTKESQLRKLVEPFLADLKFTLPKGRGIAFGI